LRDTLELQSEISGAIVQEIQGRLKVEAPANRFAAHPLNSEAQLAYWKAEYFLNNVLPTSESIHETIESAERVVRIDPAYAPAHALLSRAYILLSDSGQVPPKDVMPRAKAAAAQAVALDDNLPVSHSTLAYIHLLFDWDWTGAEREARRAIALNPSDPEGHHWLANSLAATGRTDEAVAEMKRARELDPLSVARNWNVGRMLCFDRRYDEAITDLLATRELIPNNAAADIWLFKSYWKLRDARKAFAADLRMREYRDHLDPKAIAVLRAAFAANGLTGYLIKLRELLLVKFSANPIGWYRLAEINAYLGDKEQALGWLEKAQAEHPNWIPWIKVDPAMDPLRSEPRFAVLLRNMRLI
jgi:tetratricopeptide (TPR) repeat protein